MAKDLFSAQAKLYSQFRPHYPEELFAYILSFVKEKETVWDCATGNGQAAIQLVPHFNKIIATDISKEQLAQAFKHPKIEYLVCTAEATPFPDHSFDLITVAQAFHWFDHHLFNSEVQRIGKQDAVIAIWHYDRFSTADKALNKLMDDFYWNITGPYWDKERRFIDDHYSTIPFPYKRLPAKGFETKLNWTKEQMIGYLSSWSAVQQYIKVHGVSPLHLIEEKLALIWGETNEKQVSFPIYLQIGRIEK
jgi:ubiquinone/menaquinone biosynthesis C-methylase UbiE